MALSISLRIARRLQHELFFARRRTKSIIDGVQRMSANVIRHLPWQPYTIGRAVVLPLPKLLHIGKNVKISDCVVIQSAGCLVSIGDDTEINYFTVIYGADEVLIGNNVMIAPHCMIVSGNHDFRQTKVPMRFAGYFCKGPIVIEDNVWVGAHATITDGVRIGRESVVGAGAVVTRDVPPYAIVAGVPARIIGSRLHADEASHEAPHKVAD